MKRSLHIGINDYRSSPLRGCINDMNGWAEWFTGQAFDRVELLADRDAKVSRVTAAIRAMLEVSGPGDVVRITYSGHGTRVPDVSGDEADRMDEAWVLYDGVWLDDEIGDLLFTAPEGIDIGIVSDSCHSGTVSRGLVADARPRGIPRCIPYALSPDKPITKVRRLFSPRIQGVVAASHPPMNHVLLAGARPHEYSWDAEYEGVPWGALTFNALKILREHPRVAWKRLDQELSWVLPSRDYPQHPQLEGPEALRRHLVG